MRKIILISIALLLTLSFGFAQQKDPVMNFTKTKIDFGDLKQENGPASRVFEFTNTGGKPVIISNVTSSCGCTTPTWSKQPIPPGKKGFVEAVYDPRNRPGNFSKTITVYSNSANSPVQLNVVGNVVEKQNPIAESYPQQIGDLKLDNIYLNFGNIYNDETKTLTLNVYNPTSSVMSLTIDKTYTPAYLNITVSPEQIGANQKGKITVTYDASKVNDWDYIVGYVYLNINGVRVSDKRIQISAIINERFTQEQRLNPPKIVFDSKTFDFDTINEGQVIEHVFTFKNTGTSDLFIRKTRSSCGCTAVNSSNDAIKPGETGTIKAVFNTTHKQNNQIKTVTLITNCPENEYNKIVLRIEGFVKPQKN